MFKIALLIMLFAIFDRWCGGGMGWKATNRGRPIYYVIALIPVWFWTLGWQLGILLAAWCIWRLPAWKLFGGSLAPTTEAEIEGTVLRHALIIPALLICLEAGVIERLFGSFLIVLWVAMASYLSVYNAEQAADQRDVNGSIELARGGLFGLFAGMILYVIEALS